MGLLDFLRKKDSLSNYAIALDIGTEFIKALIFRVEKEKGYVIGVGRCHQKLSDMSGGAVTDISGVIQNCEIALEESAKQAGFLPQQVIIGIAGELVKGTTTWVSYEREQPNRRIEVKELREIMEQVEGQALEKARGQLSYETGQRAIDIRLVNSAIAEVKIDGFRVTNPIGFQGREIEVGVFNAFAPIVHLGALQTIAGALELELLSIASEPYAVARSVGLEEAIDFSAIFLDIGGGTTDIAVVRAGGVEGTRMFALGGRSFTRRLAQELNLSFQEAEIRKLRYSKGELSEKDGERIKKLLLPDAEVWRSGIELALEEFVASGKKAGHELLPSKFLLCGGGSALPEVKELLSERDWSRHLPFARKPTIAFIAPEEVASIEDQTGLLSAPQDITPLALANLAIDLAGEPSLLEGMLEKITSSLRA